MLLQQLVNGVMLGSTYALIAIGYTLVFGVLHLVHLAHGEVFMIGAFIGLFVVLWTGAGVVAALVGGLVGAALLGVLIELVAFRPIRARGGHVLAPMISTIGVGIVLQEVATRLFGSELVGFPHRLEPITLRLGPVTVTSVQLLILGVALVLMVALHALRDAHAALGMAMRATAESALTARLLGINTSRIILLTFAIASGLGGVAGVLVGLAFNAISPFMGIDMGVKGLAIMLIGGLGNIHGAMVGGMIARRDRGAERGVPRLVLPRRVRLRHDDRRSCCSAPRGCSAPRESVEDSRVIDQYTESVLIFLGINIVLALSLALPVSAGLLSLGQGGFMAIGAYVSAVLTVWWGVPFARGPRRGRPRRRAGRPRRGVPRAPHQRRLPASSSPWASARSSASSS